MSPKWQLNFNRNFGEDLEVIVSKSIKYSELYLIKVETTKYRWEKLEKKVLSSVIQHSAYSSQSWNVHQPFVGRTGLI
jgi:hypothetical protein